MLCRLGFPFPEFTNFIYDEPSDKGITVRELGRLARPGSINRKNEGEGNNGVNLDGSSRSYQDCQRQTSSGDNSGNKESGHIITIRIK